MSSADDILFEPIGATAIKTANYQPMLDAVTHALDALQDYGFRIEENVPIEIYNQIADLVENDPRQIKYVEAWVTHDPSKNFRPHCALSIRDVFARMQRGENKFWFAGKKKPGNFIRQFEFENWFAIEHQLAKVKLLHQHTGHTDFEWWIASLLSNFTGYQEHYAFGSEDEAIRYHNTP